MLNLLYLIFLAPIEFCMQAVFDGGYSLTHSYGLALIGVSLVVNTAVLPIYNKAEAWQEEERALKKRMAPKEQMIRRCFKGQERFAMISTLYRQSGYSPLMTLRASVGILLQIPFFFAAYQLLSNMPVLDGVSFGPIRNLGAPDGLLVIGGVSINVLPILMTLINLFSAFFYTHGLSRRDKIQLYAMAALFLVLLYNSPAGLTFYWTLNNIYSLCKNIVQKNWMKRQGWLAAMQGLKAWRASVAQKLLELAARVVTVEVRLSALTAFVALCGLMMLAYGLYAGRLSAFVMGAALLGASLLLLYLDILAGNRFARPGRLSFFHALAVLVGVCGGAFILCKYGVIQGNVAKLTTRAVLLAILVLALGFARPIWEKLRASVLAQKKELGRLYLPAGGLILFLIFVYFPFVVFSSDPVVFDMTLDAFTAARLGIFFVALLCLAVAGALLGAARWLFGALCLILALAALTFSFIVAPDVGVMDSFILQNADALYRWYNSLIDAAVGVAVLLLFLAVLRFGKIKLLADVIYAALAILVLMTGVHFFTAKDLLAAAPRGALAADDSVEIPPQIRDFFTFSKNGKNIVIVMLDMFTGGNMNQLLERYPALKTELDGFTWYEDVVTGGSSTIYGKPGILGGEAAHPLKMNEDAELSLEEKVAIAYATFFKELHEKNFRISVFDEELFQPDLVEKYLPQSLKTNFIKPHQKLMWAGALDLWKEKHHYSGRKIQNFHRFFDMIGCYNIAPLKLKGKVYAGGTWNKTLSLENFDIMHAATQLANFELPLYASNISDSDMNSLMYVINILTHVPWAIDQNGLPSPRGAWYKSRILANNGLSEEHLLTEYFSLKKLIEWFDWMKKHGVYDNTQIILVSDHGKGDSADVVKMWGKILPISIHGLMLVKEYGAHGELLIDRTSQMTSLDVQTLIRNGLVDEGGARAFPWKDPSRERMHVSGNWRRGAHSKNAYTFSEIYKIQGPLYKKESWTKIK